MSSVLKKNLVHGNSDKMKSIFVGLGKPTMRGVRKCLNCGTMNGTRGTSCKNKLCGAVFKDRGKKKGHSAEGVKIHAGPSNLIYSVRLRDRGPDYRGFVQLPIFQDLDGNPAAVDAATMAQSSRCFVESCLQNFGSGGLKQTGECVHIRTAIHSTEEAAALEYYDTNINGLSIPSDMQEALNELFFETAEIPGPMVQRVTRNIMVVKCKVTNRHPLGFLHVAFTDSNRNRAEAEHKFTCSCKEFKNARDFGLMREESKRRCVHFYACICAFSCNEVLAKEFGYYLNTEPESQMNLIDQVVSIDHMVTDSEDQLIAFVRDAQHSQESDSLLLASEVINDSKNLELIIDGEVVISSGGGGQSKQQMIMNDAVFEDGQLVCLQTVEQDSSALLTVQDNKYSTPSTASAIICPPSVIRLQPVTLQRPLLPNMLKKTSSPVDEKSTSLSFIEWLSSVTDRINDTMHYQFDGNPDALVFHVPQKFFDCLQQRISSSSKKKRLPNTATAFVRKEALPLGTFTKYTWNITNILHVKQIFDTPERPLELSRRFVENRDGSFDLYNAPKESTVDLFGKQPIRPFELKTFLKVGYMSADHQEPPIPFTLEWIPDVLPKSRIGELRIRFQYGHERNGQAELRTIPNRTIN